MEPLFKELNSALVQNLGRPRTALLVGRGVAETAYVLRGRGAKTTAVELDPASFEKARDLADEAILATK
ncbi:MAG: hypothetical protein EON55_14710, partial [Alphaproteobacteria bacterium]